MATTKQPEGAPTTRLLGKWMLLGSILRDQRSRQIHAKVAWVILDQYWEKYGNGRASVSFIQSATGLTRGSVAAATADLVGWGYFTRNMGAGKRPTEYIPDWNFGSVLQSQDANSVLQPPDACVLQSQDATAASVLWPQEQTHLLEPAYSAVTVSESIFPDAPLAPPCTALDGPGRAGTSGSRFEELWEAYGLREKRADARSAYERLNPDEELHRELVALALVWREQYEAIGTEKKWRYRLHNWLAREHYLEDLPEAYEDPKAEPRKNRAAAVPPQPPAEPPIAPPARVATREPATVVSAHVDTVAGDDILVLEFTTSTGQTISRSIVTGSGDHGRQAEGQSQLTRFVFAAGLDAIEYPGQAVGACVVVVTSPSGGTRYEPFVANDNGPGDGSRHAAIISA